MPPLEDCDDLEQIFAAETADAEGLEPCTLGEAHRHPDWAMWECTIEEEITTLQAAGTWRLEELPLGANVIGSKWVFKAKKDASGRVVHYKACLVAKGFSQIDGVDYDDTYAPVAKLASTRAILALANRLAMELQQFDVKAAYLNGELTGDEVLYLQHPPGYSTGQPKKTNFYKCLFSFKRLNKQSFKKVTLEKLFNLKFSAWDFKILPIDSFWLAGSDPGL
jgi:hypothetical protein